MQCRGIVETVSQPKIDFEYIFNDSLDKKLSRKQRRQKEEIEKRILKIEAFEFQNLDD